MLRSRNLLLSLKKTSLNSLHKEHKGKMVEFCGWELPVQYQLGVLGEHIACRQEAAIFDVAHMRQLVWRGKDRIKFLERVTPVSLTVPGLAKLSVILNDNGGVIDDTILTLQDDHVYQIVNAGCADKDVAYFKSRMAEFKGDVHLEELDRSLVALQGPKAASIMQGLINVDLTYMNFMTGRNMNIQETPCYVTRCGYTGEDGFEISVDNNKVDALVSTLIAAGAKLSGLGARDSLRLEAGLCLYGNELNEDISPIEAGLQWLILKKRKENGGFIGFERVKKDLVDGVNKKRVGLFVQGSIARDSNSKIFDYNGTEVGFITSGTRSPILQKSISMGYVSTPLSKEGTNLFVEVRGKKYNAVVTSLPFVQTHYYRAPKKA